MSVHVRIISTLLRRPTRTLIHDDSRSWRGAELLAGALHLAGRLEGVSHAPTLGVLLPTGGAFPMAALAGWMLGKTVVPINYLLARDEMQYVIDDSDADVIVSAGRMIDALGFEPRCDRLIRLDELRFGGVPPVRWPARRGPDDVAVLLYTSGTSGRPKGVMLTHGNIMANLRQAGEAFSFSSKDVLLGVLPQFHSFGFTVLTVLPLVFGATTVYTARFIPQRIVRLLRQHRPTLFVGIPSMYRALLSVKSATPEDFACLRVAASGGEALPRDVSARFYERFGVRICEGYGLTETSPITNVCLPADYREGSVGPAMRRLETRIADADTGVALPPGRDGEVRFRGPNVMKGYYKLPEATAAAFDEDGFFRTGDMGRLDQDDHLYITGRIKEMLIVGGENVFPREIEEVLDRHPSVKASGVIGVADGVRGETPVAFVEIEDGAAFDQPTLRTWCRDNLAGYKVPKDIIAAEALPRGPTGKVLRRKLTELLGDPSSSAPRASVSADEQHRHG